MVVLNDFLAVLEPLNHHHVRVAHSAILNVERTACTGLAGDDRLDLLLIDRGHGKLDALMSTSISGLTRRSRRCVHRA